MIGEHLVVRVHRRDGVLQVHDRRHGRLEDHVGDAGLVDRADRVRAVDLQLEVEPVLAQQHGRGGGRVAAVAGELIGHRQAGARAAGQRRLDVSRDDRVRLGVRVGARGQRHHVVEQGPHPGDDAVAADGVVGAVGRRVAHHVGAVDGVVERSPAGVGGVQRVARVVDRHDELRPGHLGDLRIDALGVDQEVRALRLQVLDLLQEGAVLGGVEAGAGMLAVPAVDRALQVLAPGEQRGVARAKLVDEVGEPLPERRRFDAGARQRLVLDEAVQRLRHLQPGDLFVCLFSHGSVLSPALSPSASSRPDHGPSVQQQARRGHRIEGRCDAQDATHRRPTRPARRGSPARRRSRRRR